MEVSGQLQVLAILTPKVNGEQSQKKSLTTTEDRTLAVQPVAHRYTD
jgi:hypothetical protein